MTKQWTAEDQRAADDRVSWAIWEENAHANRARENTIAERCEEAERLRKEGK